MKITNIEIVNESKDVLDPFIRFIIGGNHFVLVRKKGSSNVYIPHGHIGIIHCTDVTKFLEGG